MALRAEGVTKFYGKRGGVQTMALEGVSMGISQQELVALVGPSGSGKSTLVHLLSLIDRPDQGRITLDGHDVSATHSLWLVRGRKIAVVFQAFNLISRLTALENVVLPLLVRGVAAQEAYSNATRGLEQVGLGPKAKSRPGELSGGEQQRVAIARALVSGSDYVLADEPTGNLDSENAELVANLLSDLSKSGKGVLIATHDVDLAARANRIIRLKDGRIIGEEERRELNT